MSLDKIRSAKNITYTDRYSRNPIINTLIKNKLETEMVSVKKNFANILSKQTVPDHGKMERVPMRRNKSYSINPKMIKQAIQYNPTEKLYQAVEQFVANRQNNSFLITAQELKKVNEARQQFSGLATKFNQSDEIRYTLPTPQNLKRLSQQVEELTVKQHSQDAWLPSLPEVTRLIEDQREELQDKAETKQQMQRSMRVIINQITGKLDQFHLQTARKQTLEFPLSRLIKEDKSLRPVTYTPQRYHKNDYKMIDAWLDSTIRMIASEKQSIEDKLNLLYSSYMCVWKEIIRLTYIQSEEKGLIVEKMFYSLLRLFSGLISKQHELCRSYERSVVAENLEIKKAMEDRMEKLNKKYIQQQQQMENLRKINDKLSKLFVCYEKVNHELVEELEKMTHDKKHFERELNKVGNDFYKAMEVLYQKDLVGLDYSGDNNSGSSKYKTYLLINNSSKATTLGRFKCDDSKDSHRTNFQFEDEDSSRQLKQYHSRYGHRLQHMENEVTRFWQKKQNDLEIKGIINSLVLEIKAKDACVGTIAKDYSQNSCQFPQNKQNQTQRLLKELTDELKNQFAGQKCRLETQLQQKQLTFQKWKSSTQQAQEKNKMLMQMNSKLQQTIKRMKQDACELTRQIDSLTKSQQQNSVEIDRMNNIVEAVQQSQQSAVKRQQKAKKERQLMKQQLDKQVSNNKILVKANLQAKEKVEKYQIKYNGLLHSIKGVAPWLEKFMVQVEYPLQQINLTLLKEISSKIQQNLSEFVVKDSSLFMTRLI